MDLIYISKELNTHEKCVKYLEQKRWNDIPKCPYCGSEKSSPKRLRHTCSSCNNSFSVTVRTVFENSNLPLYKWFMAISIILAAKKGVSSLQLSRDIRVNKNTAWLMQMKIRAAMENDDLGIALTQQESGISPIKFKKRDAQTLNVPRRILSYKVSDVVGLGGYWTHLKRAIIGQYHQIDEFYLHFYLSERKYKQCHSNLAFNGFERLLAGMLFVQREK